MDKKRPTAWRTAIVVSALTLTAATAAAGPASAITTVARGCTVSGCGSNHNQVLL
jgi:hypothetical protein